VPKVAIHGMTKVESQKIDLSFEAAMERLEKIVSEMESSKLPLAELLLRYEEGGRLIAICNEHLEAAENRIETLSRNLSTKVQGPATERPKESSTTSTNETSLF
jgi:exodeoxyribonuclease VII small subunit